MSRALQDTFDVLKPGGIVGIVQHAAPSDADDAWANGSKGYLKQTFVIEQMQAAGFEYVAASDINANPRDIPGADDVVWRLPPTLAGSKDDETERRQCGPLANQSYDPQVRQTTIEHVDLGRLVTAFLDQS